MTAFLNKEIAHALAIPFALNTQFSIATHIMASLGYASGAEVNSALIAGSVNISSSFVRRTLAKLSKAGLVETATGKPGAVTIACNWWVSLLSI